MTFLKAYILMSKKWAYENGFHQSPSKIVNAEGGCLVKMPEVFLNFENKFYFGIYNHRSKT